MSLVIKCAYKKTISPLLKTIFLSNFSVSIPNFVFGIIFLLATVTGARADDAPQEPPAIPVLVDVASMQDFTSARTYTGRIEAVDTVELRARVDGYLKEKHFEEGEQVKKDQLLFTIDPDVFEISVRQAEANLANAQAAESLAQKTFDRYKGLVNKNAISKATYDSAQASLLQAKATVQARTADLDQEKLQLSYTKITAPMAGRVGRSAYSVGDYINSSSGALITIVSQDPMYITFPVPQHILLNVRKTNKSADSVYIKLKLSDGSLYGPEGKILFDDAQASASSDTILVRASISNEHRLLTDKQLVEVFVFDKKPPKKLVIPQAALLLDQQGSYVLSIDKNNKVIVKRIETGQLKGTLLEVKAGLKPGDFVITSGLQKIRPGIIVKPQRAEQVLKQSSLSSSAKDGE